MKSTAFHLTLVSSVLGLTSAYLTDPPTNAASDTISDCSAWVVAKPNETPNCVATAAKITKDSFLKYNPSAKAGQRLVSGNSYCIQQNWGGSAPPSNSSPSPVAAQSSSPAAAQNSSPAAAPPQTPTPTSSPTTASPSTPANGVSTPSPVQTGITSNCNKFYYVVAGDTCYGVSSKNSISLDDFYKWNSGVDSTCSNLWANTYACVGVLGGTNPAPNNTPTPSPVRRVRDTPTESPGATPSPIQPGMVSNCNKFYYVVSGDTCYGVSSKNSISLDDFYKWNSGVDSTCSNLWANTYACVGVGSDSPAPNNTPTPTPARRARDSNNGVTTPTPIQPGMVSNCNGFYLVKSGDTCLNVASANGISLDQFYSYNPSIKSDCSNLWAGYNVCVRTISSGGQPQPSGFTTSTIPVQAGPTPSPVQPGMVSGCKKFYLAKSGDGCYAISNSYGISLDDFYKWNPAVKTDCSALWAQYYVCVGL